MSRPNPPAPFPEGKGETSSSVPFRKGGLGGVGCDLSVVVVSYNTRDVLARCL